MNTNNTLTYWQYNIATGAHSVIAGGNGNAVTGACSAILGGSGNNDGGNDFTGIYGTGITASAIPGTTGGFWTNELVVPDMPVGTAPLGVPVAPAGYPSGSLWYYPDANGNNVVYKI